MRAAQTTAENGRWNALTIIDILLSSSTMLQSNIPNQICPLKITTCRFKIRDLLAKNITKANQKQSF